MPEQTDEQKKHIQEQMEAIHVIFGKAEEIQKLVIQIQEDLKLLGEREMGNAK